MINMHRILFTLSKCVLNLFIMKSIVWSPFNYLDEQWFWCHNFHLFILCNHKQLTEAIVTNAFKYAEKEYLVSFNLIFIWVGVFLHWDGIFPFIKLLETQQLRFQVFFFFYSNGDCLKNSIIFLIVIYYLFTFLFPLKCVLSHHCCTVVIEMFTEKTNS